MDELAGQALTPAIQHYLMHASASLFAGAPVEIAASWAGDDHLLWRVIAQESVAVVKLFMDAGQARSRRQFDGHTRLAPHGLAPLPLWTDRYPEGLARQLLVYRWNPGSPVDPSAPDMLAAWAAAVARLHTLELAEVRRFSPHPINLDYYWRIESTTLAQIQDWLAGPSRQLATYLTALASKAQAEIHASQVEGEAAAPTPIHGDLRIDHTLLDRGGIIFLDWELFGIGDPALEIARLLHRERHALSAAQQAHWLDHYLQQADLPVGAPRIARYRRLLALHDVTFLLGGLAQQSHTSLDPALHAALPFLHTTLLHALGEAAATYALPLPDTTDADIGAILRPFQYPHTTTNRSTDD